MSDARHLSDSRILKITSTVVMQQVIVIIYKFVIFLKKGFDAIFPDSRYHNPLVGGSSPSPATNYFFKYISNFNTSEEKTASHGAASHLLQFCSFYLLFLFADAPVMHGFSFSFSLLKTHYTFGNIGGNSWIF